MMCLITGATGEVGSRVVRRLLECGIRPRVLVRREERGRALFGDQVDISVGDFASPDSIRRAIQGINTVFLVNIGPEIRERDRMAATISKDLGVRRIVKLSSLDVEQGLAIGAWHEKGEAAIREIGIPFTFIRPTGFMSNLLAWAPSIKAEGVVRSSTGEGRRPFVHSEDTASVCAAAVLSDEYVGKALPITGPESLSFREVAEMIGEAIGKTLLYQVISDEQAREIYSRISGSSEETEAHIALWRAIRGGQLATTTDCVQRILGKKPIGLRQWVAENIRSFMN